MRVSGSLSTGEVIRTEAPDNWREPIPWMHSNGMLLEIVPGHFVMASLVVELVYEAVGPGE